MPRCGHVAELEFGLVVEVAVTVAVLFGLRLRDMHIVTVSNIMCGLPLPTEAFHPTLVSHMAKWTSQHLEMPATLPMYDAHVADELGKTYVQQISNGSIRSCYAVTVVYTK